MGFGKAFLVADDFWDEVHRRFARARSRFNSLSRLSPRSEDYVQERAKALDVINSFQAFVGEHEQLMAGNPFVHADALSFLALARLEEGRVEEALALADRSISVFPTFDGRVAKARILAAAGEHEKAVAVLSDALKEKPERVEARTEMGRLYLELGRLAEAEKSLSTAIKLRPWSDEALALRGLALLKQKKFAEALADLNEAISSNPSNAECSNARGLLWLETLHYDKALEDFNQAIALDSANARFYSNRARARFALKDQPGAIGDCTSAIENAPSNPDYHLQQAEYYMTLITEMAESACTRALRLKESFEAYNLRAKAFAAQGKWTDCLDSADKAIAFKKETSALALKARCHIELGDFKAAAKACEQALALDSGNPEARALHALSLALARDPRAEKIAQDAVNQEPGSSTALTALGIAQYNKQDHNACYTLEKAAAADDFNARAHYYHGLSLMAEKQYGDALSSFERARGLGHPQAAKRGEEAEHALFGDHAKEKTDPAHCRTWYHRGNGFYDRGDYPAAERCYSIALELNPNFSEAYFNRGLCRYNAKSYEAAISDHTRAAELDPRNAVIYNNRGDAHYRKQDFWAAVTDYDKAIELNPKYLKAFYNRGLAYACMQKYDKAMQDFENVISLNPNFADAWHIKGLAHDYTGDYANAIECYNKALALKPGHAEARAHLEYAKSKLGLPPAATSAPFARTPGRTAFESVGGLSDLKEEIRRAIVYPFKNRVLASEFGVGAGGGILLYGPPGCGKTLIANAAAGEAKVPLIPCRPSDLYDMYVGNTEKNIKQVFEKARAQAPCILFLDEIDGIGASKATRAHHFEKISMNEFLMGLDDLLRSGDVLVLAATNAPWDVDPALKRSGRFTKNIYVPPPDESARQEIFRLHLKNKPTRGIDYTELARLTNGFSGADIEAACREAATNAFLASVNGSKEPISMKDLAKALEGKKPSILEWMQQARNSIPQEAKEFYSPLFKKEEEQKPEGGMYG